MFYILVSGKRDFTDYERFSKYMDELICHETMGSEITIVQGGANGADSLAKRYAKDHDLKMMEFPANWKAFGKKAGPMRNQEMVDYLKENAISSCLCVFFWDYKSSGTGDCFRKALAAKLPHAICEIE